MERYCNSLGRCLGFCGLRELFLAIALASCLLPGRVSASRLILKIQAANPSDRPQSVDIRSSLPDRITTNDIISLAGLELGYDVKSDTYFVHGTLELGPREIAVRDVVLDDIWVVDEQSVNQLEQRASRLAGMLSATEFGAEAEALVGDAADRVQTILVRQRENRITMVPPVQHIQAYEQNLTTLQDLKQKVGRLENLVMAAGMNPGDALLGDDRMSSAPRRDVSLPIEYGEAVVEITIRNTSPTQVRTVSVDHELPPEVKVADVIDAGELEVRYDPKEDLTYVFANGLELEPRSEQVFEVRIRDKWNINAPRIDFLTSKLEELRLTTAGRSRLTAVLNTLDQAEAALTEIRDESGPEVFGPAYIAFYRRQADRLDEIERDLNRVVSALEPLETRKGFEIPAPDRKTTWVIIYSILGFLALMSLLFFLRWFIKTN